MHELRLEYEFEAMDRSLKNYCDMPKHLIDYADYGAYLLQFSAKAVYNISRTTNPLKGDSFRFEDTLNLNNIKNRYFIRRTLFDDTKISFWEDNHIGDC